MPAPLNTASRDAILTPIPELHLAAQLLDAAVTAILIDRMALAAQLLEQAHIPAIMDYAKRAVGSMSVEVHRIVKRPACLPRAERHPTRMPNTGLQQSIFMRDGWRCRFCGTKVICKAARTVLIKAFPTETRWGSKEFERHAALYALASSLDHVVPHGRGGKNEQANFVTACYCCQFGRGEWTLEESALTDPRLRAPLCDGWDGLSRLVKHAERMNRITVQG
ncbi:MAG: hypothetical protein V4723_07240 [Pseudomonadota bacterium]